MAKADSEGAARIKSKESNTYKEAPKGGAYMKASRFGEGTRNKTKGKRITGG